MAINIIVNGAHGRMGQETVAAIKADPELHLVGALNHGDSLSDNIKALKPDVVIDFTVPDSVFQNSKTIIECSARPVIGTTGLTLAQIEELQHMCQSKKLGGIIAPNFSLGAVLMMRMAQLAAPYFPNAEIIEYHHPAKKDAPSGTSIKTAQLMGYPDLPIHSVRLPGYVASQTVIFGGDEETLTIHHNSTHRKAFMPGVRMACKKVMTLDGLVYGLEKLI